MKNILLLLVILPFIGLGQMLTPKFENDTLYTSSGFKIYKGQTLHFGTGTKNNGTFRYVNIKSDVPATALMNNSIVIKKLKNFGISALGNGYISIVGTLTYNDGSKGHIEMHMAFDHAIEDNPDLPSELIVPMAFRGKRVTGNPVQQLERLSKLYQDSMITKEEFELQKQRIINKQ